LPTDRFIVAWNLDPDRSTESRGPSVIEATVEVPPDFAALQINDPTEALRWRLRVREAMQSQWARGYRVTGFVRAADDQAPHYLLTGPEGSDPGEGFTARHSSPQHERAHRDRSPRDQTPAQGAVRHFLRGDERASHSAARV